MFNIGSNDKEELEENMEEIKNLIGKNGEGDQSASRGRRSNGAEMQETQDSEFGNTDSPQADIGSPQTSSNQEQGNLRDVSTNSGNENPGNRNQSLTSQKKDSNTQQLQTGKNSLQEQESIQSQDQPRQDNVLNGDSNSQAQETPSKSTQEVESIPDDPLFLREEEFNKIREMVEEMTYLTQEMDQKVKDMKRNVREEKDTSRDSRELSKAFDERRRQIKSVVESGR